MKVSKWRYMGPLNERTDDQVASAKKEEDILCRRN